MVACVKLPEFYLGCWRQRRVCYHPATSSPEGRSSRIQNMLCNKRLNIVKIQLKVILQTSKGLSYRKASKWKFG